MCGYPKQRQTLARSMLRAVAFNLRDRPVNLSKFTKCTLVVTPLAFWACDWPNLPTETLLQEYSRPAVKLSSIDRSAVTKESGTTALVYIFETLIVDIKDCLGHS